MDSIQIMPNQPKKITDCIFYEDGFCTGLCHLLGVVICDEDEVDECPWPEYFIEREK
jgi:hypothetical protein